VAGRLDVGVLGVLGLEVVARFAEVDAGAAGEFGGDERAELLVAVDAGADGGAADGEFAQRVQGALEALLGVAELRGVAAELLPEADGRRVLQVRAADLDDLVPGLGLLRSSAPS
jgi:hypothetical protein